METFKPRFSSKAPIEAAAPEYQAEADEDVGVLPDVPVSGVGEAVQRSAAPVEAEAAEYQEYSTLRQKWGYQGQYNTLVSFANEFLSVVEEV